MINLGDYTKLPDKKLIMVNMRGKYQIQAWVYYVDSYKKFIIFA